MSRPVIGINTDLQAHEDPRRGLRAVIYMAYADAVSAAGGAPVLLPPIADTRRVPDLLAAVDGLLLSGGDDMDPKYYGEAPHPRTVPQHPQRDAFDLALTRAAIRRRVPVLGICGGHQCIDVALGGTLHQHLPDVYGSSVNHSGQKLNHRAHTVRALPGTRLARMIGAGECRVNSSHHQSVNKLGRGLIVAAVSPADGVVEAIEHEDPNRFLFGVEWHPEEMAGQLRQLGLFKKLVDAARRGKR
jgi:putative glutamine amidotransferase